MKLLADEKAEAKKERKKMKEAKAQRQKAEAPQSFGDLQNMILAKRDNAFNGLLNYMESKYAGLEEEEDQQQKDSKKRKQPTGLKSKLGAKRMKKN